MLEMSDIKTANKTSSASSSSAKEKTFVEHKWVHQNQHDYKKN
jgi:hypothetical protein